ncbi:MAG: hypothetical protein NVSMB17_16840 [Candidatus Dormibacteria bacterium]
MAAPRVEVNEFAAPRHTIDALSHETGGKVRGRGAKEEAEPGRNLDLLDGAAGDQRLEVVAEDLQLRELRQRPTPWGPSRRLS